MLSRFTTRHPLLFLLLALILQLGQPGGSALAVNPTDPTIIDGRARQKAPKAPSCTAVLQEYLNEDLRHKWNLELMNAPESVQQAHRNANNVGIAQASLNLDGFRNVNPQPDILLPESAILYQESAGICWIEARLEQLANRLVAEGKVNPGFKFSDTFIHKMSQLERYDHWLAEMVAQLRPKLGPLQLAEIMDVHGRPESAGDGGYYEWTDHLIMKYGLAPEWAMPKTADARATQDALGDLETQLTLISQRMMETFARMARYEFKPHQQKLTPEQFAEFDRIRKDGSHSIHTAMDSLFGRDPGYQQNQKKGLKPGEFEVTDAQGVTRVFNTRTFADDFAGFAPNEFVVVSANPLLPTGQFYQVPNSSIGIPSKEDGDKYNLHFLNVSRKRMWDLTWASLKYGYKPGTPPPRGTPIRPEDVNQHLVNPNGYPVWFAGNASNGMVVERDRGLIDVGTNSRDAVHQFKGRQNFGKLKRQWAVMVHKWGANHAMVFTGGRFGEWLRDQNSWSKNVGYNGHFPVTRAGFNRDVYQVVVPRKVLSKEELEQLDGPRALIPSSLVP